jgi:hypothetical protein
MTKALSSYPQYQRKAVALQRVRNGEKSDQKGLGYWGAKDATKHFKVEEVVKEEEESNVPAAA